MSQNSPESENVSAPTQMELFPEYEHVEQDGFITVHPPLSKLFEKYSTPKPMEIEKGSISFEKKIDKT